MNKRILFPLFIGYVLAGCNIGYGAFLSIGDAYQGSDHFWEEIWDQHIDVKDVIGKKIPKDHREFANAWCKWAAKQDDNKVFADIANTMYRLELHCDNTVSGSTLENEVLSAICKKYKPYKQHLQNGINGHFNKAQQEIVCDIWKRECEKGNLPEENKKAYQRLIEEYEHFSLKWIVSGISGCLVIAGAIAGYCWYQQKQKESEPVQA